MAAGRIRGRFAFTPRSLPPRIAPLRAFFLCYAMGGGFRFRENFNAMSISPLQSLKEFFGTHVLGRLA